jgi:oligoribonuclease (3'-5' exoribonuclease)
MPEPVLKVIITDGQLKTVHDGIEYVIRRDKSILDKYVHWFFKIAIPDTSCSMGEWCTNQHGAVSVLSVPFVVLALKTIPCSQV